MAATCGLSSTWVITEHGEVFGWGTLDEDQAEQGPGQSEPQRLPARVGSHAEFHFKHPVAIAAGSWHVAAVDDSGALWTWGRGKEGQLGHGRHMRHKTRPARLSLPGSCVRMVTCGGLHTIALTAEGHVFTCGSNAFGQLGHGDADDRFSFTRVGALSAHIVAAAAGHFHSIAVSAQGSLYTWGDGAYGCLGLGDEEQRMVPTQLGSHQFMGSTMTAVATGFAHTLALGSDGALFVWGWGFRGQP